MSLYPCRQDLRPVDHTTDPAIVPTQFIAHVSVTWASGSGPGFHDGLDWHFYVASGPGRPEDIVTQLRDTYIQADANFHANGPRADGSGAVSFESEGTGEEPWDDDQLAAIIWLFRKGNEIDNIPLRLCTAWDAPGVGYHRLFNEWNKPYHSCPGDAKVQQFRDIILPALQQPQPMPPTTQEDDVVRMIQFADWPGKLWLVEVKPNATGHPGQTANAFGTRRYIPDWGVVKALQEAGVQVVSGVITGGGLYQELDPVH